MCYIAGGVPEGTTQHYTGCTDKTPPRADRRIIIPHELYFAKSSPIWEDKAVAFIKSARDEVAQTLGRMYLISQQQFEQVVRQENGLSPEDKTLILDFGKINEETGFIFDSGKWYGRVLDLGEEAGYPILTFTAPRGDDEIVRAEPGEKYLETIRKGIKEIYDISDTDITKYFIARIRT